MAAFDQLREEFDRLSREEQLGLSIQGLFSTYRQGNRGSSNQSLFSDANLEADLSKRSTNQMSSFMASQTYRVKISDVLTDIVNPLGDMFDGTAARDRIHRNSLHHESTLYQQGIIDAVKEQGEENRTGFVRATMLGYERFKRDPLWSSLNVLGKVLTTTLRTSWAILFGRDKRTVEEKMLDELKKHTEYYKTGEISKDGFFTRLGRQGVLGMIGRRAFSEIATGFSWLFPKKDIKLSEKDIMSDTNEKTTEILSVLHDILYNSVGINESVKLYGSGIFNSHLLAFSENGMMSQLFTASMNQQMSLVEVMSSTNKTTEDLFGGFNAYSESWKDYRDLTFDINEDVRDELVEHNKREKRRSFMGILGKIFTGVTGVLKTIGGFVTRFPVLVSSALLGALSTGGFARTIAASVGGAIARFLAGSGFRAALRMALRTPIGVGLATLFRSEEVGAGSDFGGLTTDHTFTTTTMDRMAPVYANIERLRRERVIVEEERQDNERSDRLISINNEIAELEQQIVDIRRQAQRNLAEGNTPQGISPAALYSARLIGEMSDERQRSSGRNEGLLTLIRRAESGGDYNQLTYGRPGEDVPDSANLTNMTIAEVMRYQAGMRDRGHATSAVGAYQIVEETLARAVRNTEGVRRSSLFDQEAQDRLANALIEERRSRASTVEEFGTQLGMEWDVFRMQDGRSYYGNPGSVDWDTLMRQLERPDEFQYGGRAGFEQRIGRRLNEAGDTIADGAESAKKRILDVFTGGNMGGGLLDRALEAVGINTSEANAERPAVITNESMQTIANVMESASLRGFTRAMESFEQSGGTVQISGDLDD